ncbi:MAG TPA: ectonucleotide pyrophosphatase/phosphodiesterase [Vicinamibacterales bacterium]|nr:ectonucleotide pyrophosphatase/phosphodiesterase [Vicinamibacterales bacterium]
MKRAFPFTGVVAILFAISVAPGAKAQSRPAASPNHVIIITLDGFGGWALDDPHLPLPTLRKLAAQGAVAKGMRPVNPTVTWPNHTSIVTGVTPAKHGVLFNGTLIRETGVAPRVEPWIDKKEMVKVETLYDAAHARGMTTAQVDWVAIYNAPTITWEFRERPPAGGGGAIAAEMVKAGLVSQADVDAFSAQNIIFRDDVWTKAANHILKQHKPNLLLFHLLTLDSIQHRYGPRTPAAMATMALLDSQVASIVRTLEETGLAKTTTLFILSDHGFKAVKRQILPNAALLKAGLLEATDGKIAKTQAYVVPEGGSALVYITVPDASGEILARTRQALAGIEGIDKIIEPADYSKYGLPLPSENQQMGALFLTAKEGYAFAGAAGAQVVIDVPDGSLGAHGYVSSDPDLQSLFIASGRGIKPGVTLETVDNLDIAPTAARLLGLELKGMDGKVLTEILGSSPR